MSTAHILVLEDDPQWQDTIRDVLRPLTEHVTGARDLDSALALLGTTYFNAAIVDLRLRAGDPKDTQGMAFLKELQARNLSETVRCIMLSAFGDMERIRLAFRDFGVVDFLSKVGFDPEELRATVQRALALNHLDRTVQIEVAREDSLRSLWTGLNWPLREDPAELEAELHDLLCRLFPDADQLFIQRLRPGQSGAGVLQIEPFYQLTAGAPVILKFGKKDKIHQEKANYDQFVERFAGAQSTTQLRAVLGRAMGAITYQLIGTELHVAPTFGEFYARRSPQEVCAALDHLFRHTCGRWYDNWEQPRRTRDLVQLYGEGLHVDWNEVWQGAEATGVDLRGDTVEFPGVAGSFPNPKRWLEARDYALWLPVWRAITHGDLNQDNVLVVEDGHCWLIDFYRTGWGHILRDAIELETSIKFALTPGLSLAEHQAMEEHLLRQVRLDQPVQLPASHPQAKSLAVISHVRGLASDLVSQASEMEEYNSGLLLNTLNLLRIHTLQAHHLRALLSAAILCQWLSANSDKSY